MVSTYVRTKTSTRSATRTTAHTFHRFCKLPKHQRTTDRVPHFTAHQIVSFGSVFAAASPRASASAPPSVVAVVARPVGGASAPRVFSVNRYSGAGKHSMQVGHHNEQKHHSPLLTNICWNMASLRSTVSPGLTNCRRPCSSVTHLELSPVLLHVGGGPGFTVPPSQSNVLSVIANRFRAALTDKRSSNENENLIFCEL